MVGLLVLFKFPGPVNVYEEEPIAPNTHILVYCNISNATDERSLISREVSLLKSLISVLSV